MSNYIRHLQELSTSKTFKRKIDYIDYNLGNYLKKVGLKNIMALEVGPGMGEFESYLNSKKISEIDIVDNDKEILNYVSSKYKIRNAFLIKKIKILNEKISKYNFIFLMQVLEHLPTNQYVATIKSLYNHLERNGYLIIVVPNGNNPLGLLERYADLQHTGCFTQQSLKDLVTFSGIKNYQLEIKGYEIPPYDLINLIRITLQKILHFFLLLIMIVNGGLFFKTMTPNIMLVIKKNRLMG